MYIVNIVFVILVTFQTLILKMLISTITAVRLLKYIDSASLLYGAQLREIEGHFYQHKLCIVGYTYQILTGGGAWPG